MDANHVLPPLDEEIERAVELCRADNWREGLEVFATLSTREAAGAKFPAEYYSYLGFGVARYQRRIDEGVKLCEHAARLEPDNPDVLLNLAKLHLLLRNRLRGVQALSRGLKLHPRNEQLNELRTQIGVRRRPVIPFLRRDHPVNSTLGRVRARLHSEGAVNDEELDD